MNSTSPNKLGIKSRLLFLAKDSFIYGGAAVINKAFVLITFPLLSRHFSVEDYGLVDLFTVTAFLLSALFVFGQDSAVARYFYEYEKKDERKQIISQSLLFQLLCVFIFLPILWALSSTLSEKLHHSLDAPLLLKLVILQVPLLVIINFSQNLLKWTFSRKKYLFMSLGSVAINMSLLLLAVYVFNIGVAGVFIVGLVTQSIFAVLGIFFVRHWLELPRGFDFLRMMLPFAIPYGIVCSAGSFVPVMERYLIDSILGAYELGLYAAGAKIAMISMLVVQAFQTAWGPFSLAIHKEEDAGQTYIVVLKAFVTIICVTVLLLSAVGETAITILASDRYADAAVVVFPLSMGLAIQGISWITEIGVSLSKKTYLSLYSYTVFVLVTCLSIYFLANIFGLIGAAMGFMVGHIAKSITASWLAQRVYPFSWPYPSVVSFVFLTVIVGFASQMLTSDFSQLERLFLSGLGILVVSCFGWLVLLTRAERSHVKSMIHNRIT